MSLPVHPPQVVVRLRPPLPRELRGTGLRPYQCTTDVDAAGRNITLSENLPAVLSGGPGTADGLLYATYRWGRRRVAPTQQLLLRLQGGGVGVPVAVVMSLGQPSFVLLPGTATKQPWQSLRGSFEEGGAAARLPGPEDGRPRPPAALSFRPCCIPEASSVPNLVSGRLPTARLPSPCAGSRLTMCTTSTARSSSCTPRRRSRWSCRCCRCGAFQQLGTCERLWAFGGGVVTTPGVLRGRRRRVCVAHSREGTRRGATRGGGGPRAAEAAPRPTGGWALQPGCGLLCGLARGWFVPYFRARTWSPGHAQST